jgi:hypothetical protein
MMLDFALKSDKNPLFIIIDYITNCLNVLSYGENFHYMMRHCRGS